MEIARYCIWLFCLFLYSPFIARYANASESLAVLYPKVPGPTDRVFQEIVHGIRLHHSSKLYLIGISQGASPEDTLALIEEKQPELLIALGKRGYRIAKRIYQERPVAVGAVPIRPNGISGISLLADPAIILSTLKDLAPNIRKVHVVYSPGSRWLIDIAQQDAKTQSLQLNGIEVVNLKSAVNAYEQLQKEIDVSTEAIWLPDDQITAHEQVILPELLASSWEQKLVLVSSSVNHAKRGALFSVIPDNIAMGEQLLKMITAIHDSQSSAVVTPLSHLKLAVNLRTAAHLGYDYSPKQRQQFHLTYPK